jgi:hypothetical protein
VAVPGRRRVGWGAFSLTSVRLRCIMQRAPSCKSKPVENGFLLPPALLCAKPSR